MSQRLQWKQGFPKFELFSRRLLQTVESGVYFRLVDEDGFYIPGNVLNKTCQGITRHRRPKRVLRPPPFCTGTDQKKTILDIEHLEEAFLWYLGGMAAAGVVFFVEFCMGKVLSYNPS